MFVVIRTLPGDAALQLPWQPVTLPGSHFPCPEPDVTKWAWLELSRLYGAGSVALCREGGGSEHMAECTAGGDKDSYGGDIIEGRALEFLCHYREQHDMTPNSGI